MPTVCLIIAECSALNTCGIVVICTVLALGSAQVVCSECVCSAFSIWCQLWFCACQVLSNLCRQRFILKVCPAPVRFGICSAVSARSGPLSAVCSGFRSPQRDQCSQKTSGTVAGAQRQRCIQCLQWPQPTLPAHSPLAPTGVHAHCSPRVQPPVPDVLLACCALGCRSPWCARYKLPDAFAICRACCTALAGFLLFSLRSVPGASRLRSGSVLCADSRVSSAISPCFLCRV